MKKPNVASRRTAPWVMAALWSASVLAAAWGGYRLAGVRHRGVPDSYEVRSGGFRFTNPLLECELVRDAPENDSVRSIQSRVQRYVDAAGPASRVGAVSVYFRDLNHGEWFSINPVEDFVPASLLKVPVMMALYAKEEKTPGVLSRWVRFEGREDLNALQSIRPSVHLQPRRSYTVDELIRRMIVYSDNNAAALLLDLLEPGELGRLYADLGVHFDGALGDESFLSAASYASFLRILYNASYLTKPLSEKALALMAEARYKDGLPAGVPPGIPVAHKFGEWKLHERTDSPEQLHDCGIVYHPAGPYALIVMTRGRDFSTLDDVIAGVSRVVYDEVSRLSGQGVRPPPP